MLSGPEIMRLRGSGEIVIDPEPVTVNPNSVNLRLADKVMVYNKQLKFLELMHSNYDVDGQKRHLLYTNFLWSYAGSPHSGWTPPLSAWEDTWCQGFVDQYALDPRKPIDPAKDLTTYTIPTAGYVLLPGVLYLGSTIEVAGSTTKYAPRLEGRSTWARFGLSSHQTGGWGDVGFRRQWTLEITVTTPVIVRAGDEICQVAFDEVTGTEQQYVGSYVDQAGPTPPAPLKAK